MAVIAVPGGSGHIGRAIVEFLAENTNNKIIVLGRKASDEAAEGTSFFAVDYSDTASLTKILKDNNVTTVICTISVMDESASQAQLNLIEAAAKSSTVTRFVASEWGLAHTEESFLYPLRHAAMEALAKTSLQWTGFYTGYFLDYYGPPGVVKTYLPPGTFAVDVSSKAAAIPGTGNDMASFIYSFDVPKFVAKLLDKPSWSPQTYAYGDRLTLNELLALAEKSRGSKFSVVYDPPEKLAKHEVTEIPGYVQLYQFMPKPAVMGFMALFGRMVIAGRFDMRVDETLNAEFPDVETTKAAEILALWEGK